MRWRLQLLRHCEDDVGGCSGPPAVVPSFVVTACMKVVHKTPCDDDDAPSCLFLACLVSNVEQVGEKAKMNRSDERRNGTDG